jgi:hypothetical protein
MKPKELFQNFFTNVFSNKSATTSRAGPYCAGSNQADRLRHAGIDSQGAIPIRNDSSNMIALDGERIIWGSIWGSSLRLTFDISFAIYRPCLAR